ncbi:MAG: hypothetical protein GX557_06820 [Chloroflexi bacterium]|nr:hypothetical protein [Chloroflexota bacterium]
MPMTHRERLETVFAGETPDLTPVLGGWIANPAAICAFSGASVDEYWADPRGVSLRAYHLLDTDGLIDLFVPKHRNDFRCVDHEDYMHGAARMSIEQALTYIEALPSAAETESSFDLEAEYETFSARLRQNQALCDALGAPPMVWMPAQWSAEGRVTWYSEFGYEGTFEIVGAYPEHARKMVEVGGARGYNNCRLVARAVREGLYPHAMLFGEDICSQRGPVISPRFLERHYAPQLARNIALLQEAGCRPVWHSDGDVRPLVDMLIACGVQGFQGFQPECGMTLEYITSKRTREGSPLIIFGPLAVTTEMPFLSADEIHRRARAAIEHCRGRASLVMLTGNTINPDIPLDNIRAMYRAVRER